MPGNIARTDPLRPRARLGLAQRSVAVQKTVAGQTDASSIRGNTVSTTSPVTGQILVMRNGQYTPESPQLGATFFLHGILESAADTHTVLHNPAGTPLVTLANTAPEITLDGTIDLNAHNAAPIRRRAMVGGFTGTNAYLGLVPNATEHSALSAAEVAGYVNVRKLLLHDNAVYDATGSAAFTVVSGATNAFKLGTTRPLWLGDGTIRDSAGNLAATLTGTLATFPFDLQLGPFGIIYDSTPARHITLGNSASAAAVTTTFAGDVRINQGNGGGIRGPTGDPRITFDDISGSTLSGIGVAFNATGLGAATAIFGTGGYAGSASYGTAFINDTDTATTSVGDGLASAGGVFAFVGWRGAGAIENVQGGLFSPEAVAGASAPTNLSSVVSQMNVASPGVAPTNARGFWARTPFNAWSATIKPASAYGLDVENQGRATDTGAQIAYVAGIRVQAQRGTTPFGIDVEAQTLGTNVGVGVRIAGAELYSLQLSGTAGTAASGITFGTDTNLYRSAANVLKTDDSLNVVGAIYGVSPAGLTLRSHSAATGSLLLLPDATLPGGFSLFSDVLMSIIPIAATVTGNDPIGLDIDLGSLTVGDNNRTWRIAEFFGTLTNTGRTGTVYRGQRIRPVGSGGTFAEVTGLYLDPGISTTSTIVTAFNGIKLTPSLSNVAATSGASIGVEIGNFGHVNFASGVTALDILAQTAGGGTTYNIRQRGSVGMNAFRANTQFGHETGSFGGGDGVIGIRNATTAPSSNPSNGGLLYVDGGDMVWLTSGGKIAVLGSYCLFETNTQLFSSSASFGGGVGVLGIANRTTAPGSNPLGGGVLYAEAGALLWRGSAGTVTTIAPA